jgi:CBS domain containing-hemolysin-like protein
MLHAALGPLSRLLARSMQTLHKRLEKHRSHLSGEDLKTMAEIGEAHGTLQEEERVLIHSIIEFGDTTVREIMISRLDIVALSVSHTMPEALELIRNSGHSRLPLYIDHLDNILGVVYAKDLLRYLARRNGTERMDWTRIARKPMFVPLGKKLDDLLHDFQSMRTHLAIIVDEYGGTAGLVTMEDVLEEIVGEIRDGQGELDEDLFEKIDDQTYTVDARIDLDDLNDLLELNLDTSQFDFETLGGLILDLTGAVPSEGDEVRYKRLRLRVETVEQNRIGRVVVQIEPEELEDVEGDR